MSTPLSQEHPELFHYTGIAGLTGIIKTQTLWATHYAYLNDAEEVKHFFTSRLPDILRAVVTSALDEFVKQAPENNALIAQNGGRQKAIDETTTGLITGMFNSLLVSCDGEPPFAEPYITSFCTTTDPRVAAHGLLSQWRGYGQDGGYAIVFDRTPLLELLKEEGKKWNMHGLEGDVVYSSDSNQKILEELGHDENEIKSCYVNFFKTRDQNALENIYPALVNCSCRYKHWGFKEEKEVRIVALPANKKILELAKSQGETVNEKPRSHFMRSGTPVPYINLFEGITHPPEKCLPIKRIIVGPHPNKKERKRAVEILRDQHGIKAEVYVSDIPYLG
jgi:hypothetical protein